MKKTQLNLKKRIVVFTLICIIVSFVMSSFSNVSFAAQEDGKMLAQASIDENNDIGYEGSKPGDQTGQEVNISPYYAFSYIFRYYGEQEDEVRNSIAYIACQAARNENIGYSQLHRSTFYQALIRCQNLDPSEITEKVETDCSALACTCIKVTGIKFNIEALSSIPLLATGGMISSLTMYGFKQETGNLQAGDILVNSGHAAVYVGDATATSSGGSNGHRRHGKIKLTQEEIQEYSKNAIDLDKQNFDYNGEPKEIGVAQKQKITFKEIISAIKDIINYIFGVIVSGIRVAIVGLAEGIEETINEGLYAIEGREYTSDQAGYSIEDLLYNRIPALDINIFSNTPGGKTLKENSVLYTVKNLVAGWYYSIRNIASVVLFIILLYTGLKMAISTVAKEKANYSEQLVTWLKCMVLLFAIHYLIIFILQINNIIVGIFASYTSKAGSLHDTIEARAYDVRFTVGLTGMIMYVTLIVYWVRFLLLYLRRYVYNVIYIILAPFAIVRYALDNANTKGKAGFESWLNKFVGNVIIQPAHALAYTLFMGVATEIALQSIGGFIVALVFMSQILKMDEYVLGIIRFHGSDAGGTLKKMKRPMKEEIPIKIYGQAKVYGTVARNLGRVGTGIAKPIVNSIHYKNYNQNKEPSKIAKRYIDIRNKHNQKNINKALEMINKNRITDEERINEPEKAAKKEEIIKKNQEKIELNQLKINSRNNDRAAKRTLKLRREQKQKVFKATAKETKDILKSAAGMVMAIPLAVATRPEAGIAAAELITSPSKRVKDYKDAKKEQEKDKTKNENIKQTIVLVNKANSIMTEVERAINRAQSSDDIEEIRNELLKVNKLNANSASIQKILTSQKNENENISMQTSIEKALNKIDTNKSIAEDQKKRIAKIETEKIKTENNLNEDAKLNKLDTDEKIQATSNMFSNDIVKEVVSEENVALGNKVNELKDINEQIKTMNDGKKAQTININRFINNLGKV